MNALHSSPPTDGAWTLDQLLAAEAAGAKLKFAFFWGHTPRVEGELGHHVFSQWWESPFVIDGVDYPTAEHFMMAEKARLFDDDDALQGVMSAVTPAEAKKWGRKVQNFDHDIWVAHSLDIVTRGSVAKFGSTPELRDYLVQTGNRVLVEASPQDAIWGIGMTRDDKDASLPSRWQGQNLLGFALMRARAQLSS